jgi:hypothetical protein
VKRNFAIALALFAPLASAQYDDRTTSREPVYNNFSYTLGEVRLLAVDPDGGDSADGVRIGGSALIQPEFFAAGALSTVSSGGPNGVDVDRLDLGLGYRYAIAPRIDLIGIGGLVFEDVDYGNNFSDDDIGPSLTGGARGQLTPLVELAGYVNYTDVFADSDLGIIGEGLYHATPNLSLVAGLGLSDGERSASIGARWNFYPTRR